MVKKLNGAKALLVSLFLILTSASHATPPPDQQSQSLNPPSIELVDEGIQHIGVNSPPCYLQPLIDQSDWETVKDLANLGKSIWRIINDNRPIVNVEHNTADAVPEQITHWTQLECWSPPRYQTYKVTYENALGIEVVQFYFKVLYTANGRYKSQGQYLKHVTVIPEMIDVAWAHRLDVSVKVVGIVNLNTTTDPLAGMEVQVGWKVQNPFTDHRQSKSFFIQGDGQFIELTSL